jgi:integrase
VLSRLRRERQSEPAAALIFPRRTGGPLATPTVRRAWLRALAAAGVRPLRTHSLRYFYTRALIGLGTNLKYVSRQLGHASIAITADRYGRLVSDERRVAVRGLEALLRPSPSGNHLANQDGNSLTGSSTVFPPVRVSHDGIRTPSNTVNHRVN